MSASLVGSEMCIRDRPRPTQSRLESSSAPPGALGGTGGWQRPSADRSLPVSYTHLTLPTICSV
eukprot:907947-Alexandrium_andersonii.AAC.1